MACARWALVIDGARARILRNIAGASPGMPAELVLKCESRAMRALLDSGAPPGPAAVLADRADFLRDVMRLLEAHRRSGDFTALEVFADTALLEGLRAAMPPGLARSARLSRVGALMHHSEEDLPRRLRVTLEEMR